MRSVERVRIFERLKHSIQLLACPPETQLTTLPNFVCKADELALDFDHWSEVTLHNFRSELTPSQLSGLGAMARGISEMTRAGTTVWTDDAIRDSNEWKALRTLAVAAESSTRITLRDCQSTSAL
jgi:hypothetical protein